MLSVQRVSRKVASGLGLVVVVFFVCRCGNIYQAASNDPTPIQHIVFIVKENRTFDNYFGRYPNADGATAGVTSTGRIVGLSPMADSYRGNLCNGWACTLEDVDGGRMDKYDVSTGNLDAYAAMTESDVPSYWAYARQFVLADRYFTAVHGSSFPNHLFTVAAQSGGVMDNVDNSGLGKNCDGSPSGTAPVMDANGNVSRQSPCFDFQTLPDLLERARISWKYYGEWGGILSTIRHIYASPEWKTRIADPSQFVADAVSGTLPAVSWLLPPAGVGEHPPESVCQGENWTVQMVNAVMQGPEWNSSAIFITWDDAGGLYDHAAPPQVDRLGLGPRAPLLIISPYAKSGYVSHVVYEQSSVLKFIERRYHLPALTSRDRAASDMLDSFDFSQSPRAPLIRSLRHCSEAATSPAERGDYSAFDND